MPVHNFSFCDSELPQTKEFRSGSCARSRGYERTTKTQRTRLVRNAALGGAPPIHYTCRDKIPEPFMALKPPPIGDVIQQVNELVGGDGLRGELDRNAKLLLQAALARLDVVSREEFDAQAEQLARTRARVQALEAELAALLDQLDALEKPGD